MTSKRKKSHRKGGVGFKNMPEDEKPMSKEEEEKHRKFMSLRKSHYKGEFKKLKSKPPSDDDDDDGEMNTTTQEGTTSQGAATTK